MSFHHACTGADLEIVGRGFLTTASVLLISQLSLMVTISFYHPLDLEKFYEQLIKKFGDPRNPPKTAPDVVFIMYMKCNTLHVIEYQHATL